MYMNNMNVTDLKNKYMNSRFIAIYIIIFIILFILCSFMRFIGQIPVLMIVVLIITYYIYNSFHKNINKMLNINVPEEEN